MTRRDRRRLPVGCAGLCGLLLGLIGCRSTDSPAPSADAPTLLVFAAASLSPAIDQVAEQFQQLLPPALVQLNLAGTQALRAQVEAGAQADVFLSADERHSEALHADGLLTTPKPFLHNRLVVATANERIARFDDLLQPDVRLVACAPAVPLGYYTEQALERLNNAGRAEDADALRRAIVSLEESAPAAAAKTALGEVDAGFVYATDVLDGEGLRIIELPRSMQVQATYIMARLSGAPEADAAERFLDYLVSEPAQRVFAEAGFRPLAAAERRGPMP